MPRGLVRVFAMARPKRPSTEKALVLAAAADMRGSARARAARLASMVAAELGTFIDRSPDDELTEAIVLAQSVIAPTPAFLLATLPDVDTAALFLDARCRRFLARGCQQIGELAWRSETREILAEVEALLAERYRKHLLPEIVGRNRVFAHPDPSTSLETGG